MSGAQGGAVKNDKVRVVLDCQESLVGTVVHVPQGDGDSWVIHTTAGTIIHVQHFDLMIVLNRKAQATK